MACTLLFIRHGQSLGNMSHSFLGHTDLDLSPLGYEQAQCVGNYLNKRHIDKIYSSDLIRAYHTSLPLSRLKKIEVVKNSNLREIYAGDWENRFSAELKEEFKETYGVWLNDVGNSCPDRGESVAHLQQRIITEVTKIAEENQNKTVAIFTHATPIRTFFGYIQGKSLNEIKNLLWATNASVSEARYENGKFTEIYYGKDDYLENIKTKMPKNI